MNNELYKKVAKFIPEVEWAVHEPLIEKINKLKKEKNAVILAHSYMTPEIYHCVADIVGDSLKLAKESQKAKADIIIMCGVHFMAETAKILNPNKKVLIPDMSAGCSLAESITGEDVRLLKQKSNIKLNSYEGYIRQIIVWREFIRGIYQNFDQKLENSNFFNNQKKIKSSWYDAST